MAGVIPYLGTITAVLVLLAGLAVYFLGVPAEMKEKAEEKIAEHVAEGEAKDMLQKNLKKVPESDRETAAKMATGIEKVTGGDLKNPLGKFAS